MQRAQWILGALAFLLVVALALLLAGRVRQGSPGAVGLTPTLAPPSASVAAFQGAVFACATLPEGDCNTPASVGQTVLAGGEVRTGASGTADVQTHTTVFRLENGTQVRFRDVSDAVTQVVLAVGRLFTSHDPGGRSVVRVQAGQVTIQAIDTRFSVETVKGGIYVAVPSDGGQVTILAGATTDAALRAGQEIFISAGTLTNLPAPQPISPDEVARWATVGCAWQQIADRLTPVALPPAQCPSPTATPPATATAPPPPPTGYAGTRAHRYAAAPGHGPRSRPSCRATGRRCLCRRPPTLPPGRTVPAYLATWINTDARTTGLPKLTITNKAATLSVQWFQLCAPHICPGDTTSAPFSGPPFTILSPEKHKMQITLDKAGALLTLEDSQSGTQATFRRLVARDYTGTWLNDDTENLTLPRLLIRNSGNKMIIDWSSGCFVADCLSTGPFSSEPLATDRYALSLDSVAGTQLQVDDLVQSTTYYFHIRK